MAKEKTTKKAEKKAKTTKPAKTTKTTKEKVKRGPVLKDGTVVVLSKENPRREGTKAHKLFALYAKHKTIQSYLAAGGERLYLYYDLVG